MSCSKKAPPLPKNGAMGCHQHPQNPEHLPIGQKMPQGIPHLTVGSRVYQRRKLKKEWKSGSNIYALPTIQQERGLPKSGTTVYAQTTIQQERGLPAKGDWNLSGRLHWSLWSGRSNVTHINSSNNQLQFKINNNNSTDNNPRHSRSMGGQIQQKQQTTKQHQSFIPKYKWIISNTERTNWHIQSSEFRHCALASTRQNRAKLVQRGRVQNIVAALTSPEDLGAARIRFITNRAKAKCMTLQVGQRDDGLPDQAEQNEDPPD